MHHNVKIPIIVILVEMSAAVESRILVWYRNDLRLHDHEPLHRALQQSTIIPVYCFDPRQFAQTSFGFAKTGAFRAQFLLESVADLRQSLRAIGSNLIIRYGQPERVIPQLVEQLNVTAVHAHRAITAEEVAVESALEQALHPLNKPLNFFWGHTLYHPDHLPFNLRSIPEVFTTFRKQVEQHSRINPVFPAPTSLQPISATVEPGDLPTLTDLGLEAPVFDARAVMCFKGGETAAQERLAHYFWTQDRLHVYKQTRNGMLGVDYSSKFSPWLAMGCLSPRYVYDQVTQYEQQRVQNDSTYWLVFELLWRDYFHFTGAKHGNKLFYRSGLQGVPIPWKQDWQRFDLWREGQTGYPLVDANMRELSATGFMSNRGRQNVASFLTKNLGIDWRMGAEWFESQLLDYDVCSNWGNWNYTAGVGNDARGFRFFNILKQSKDYDPQGQYVRHWLPELTQVPGQIVHEPWKLSVAQQKQYSVRLGVDYPHRIVDLFKSAEANEKIYNAAFQRGQRN